MSACTNTLNLVTGTPFFGSTLNGGSSATLFIAAVDYTNMFNPGAILTIIGGPPNGGYQQVTSSSYFAVGDPDFANVSLLMNFDGSQGSTTFLHLSSVGNTFTDIGSAAIDDFNPNFGIGD